MSAFLPSDLEPIDPPPGPLVDQPSMAPTRKMNAVAISGALTAAVIAGVNYLWPGIGDQLSPTISALIVTAVSFVAGYLTRNRA